MIASPLRISRERMLFYGAVLGTICAMQVRLVAAQGFGDWSAFWAAGATAGTPDLLNPHLHAAWMAAHGLKRTIFPYLPGAAYLWYPFRGVSLAAGYAWNAAIMTALALGTALAAARMYGIPKVVAGALTFGWAPLVAAIATGQNAPLGLLLAMYAALGLVLRSPLLAGLAAGAMLYKPSYAIAFVLLFAVRREVRALGVTALCALLWYVLSVAASAGDWSWPVQYVNALHGYFAADFAFNAEKSFAIPALLMRAGITPVLASGAGLTLLAAALPLFARVRTLEAASFAPLIALACSPHALPYDAALALPAIFWFAVRGAEPLRTYGICAAYLVAPLWFFSYYVHFDVLAVLCDGGALIWMGTRYYESTHRAHFGIADSRDCS